MKLWQRRVLGVLMFGGGIVGILLAFALLISRGNLPDRIFCLVFIAIYVRGIWCGVEFFKCRPGAERFALKYWIIHIPIFSSPFLSYSTYTIFNIPVIFGINPFGYYFYFRAGSALRYSFMKPGLLWSVGVNIFSVIMVWWLTRINSRLTSQPA